MRNRISLIALALLAGATFAAPAQADSDHNRHSDSNHNRHYSRDHHADRYSHHNYYGHNDHHYNNHSSFIFSFWPAPIYRPQVVSYYPAPSAYYQPMNYADNNYADNRYCREYNRTAIINGYPQRTYGTACYQPDGSWEAID